MKYKRLDSRAKCPSKNRLSDAGYDLYALDDIVVPSQFKLLWISIGNVIKAIVSIIASGIPLNFKFPTDIFDVDHLTTKVPTGIALEIPFGSYGQINDRSGLGSKAIKVFGGVIDSEYRGDITVCLMNFAFRNYEVKAGDRVAQIIFKKYENHDFEEATELSNSERNEKGFGSSGK